MTIRVTKRPGIAPVRGDQPIPRTAHDVAQPMRRDARALRAALAA